MDTGSITGSLFFMRAEQTQLTLSTNMVKQASEQQNKIADLLAQNTRQTPQATTIRDAGFTFSTYA